jgi:programmed cell death protein 5
MGDTEDIKRRMFEQMQGQMIEEQQRKEQEETINAQKKALLRQLLSPEARARLERIKLAKPAFGAHIENQIIMLYQMGKIRQRITDDIFKKLVRQLTPKKREITIRRK